MHPPNIFNLGNCNCNVCKYALKFKKGCKQIAENCRGGGAPSAPVHPPSWGAEHAPLVGVRIQEVLELIASYIKFVVVERQFCAMLSHELIVK